MRRRLIPLAATLCVVVTACNGSSPEAAVTTAVTVARPATTTTTTQPTTTTTTSTTTTTLPPTTTTTTTTTTLPPPPVEGWEGDGPRQISVVLTFDQEGADMPLLEMVEGALQAMGLDVDRNAEATLTLELTGTAKGSTYGDAGYCYTGAVVRGTITMSGPERPELRFRVDGDYPVTFMVSTSSCNQRRDPEDAPFGDAFEPQLKDALIEWWGPASVPYLAQILHDDRYLIRIRTEAVQALRLMDWDAIDPESQYQFLEAALWFCGRSTHITGDRDYDTYREAVIRLFAEALDLNVEVTDRFTGGAARVLLDARYGK